MVIQEDNSKTVNIGVKENYKLVRKSITVGNNYKNIFANEKPITNMTEKKPHQCSRTEDAEKKTRKKNKKHKENVSKSSDIESNNTMEVDVEDLEELRTIYTKCKAVIKKMEKKYGHLLESKEETSVTRKRHLDNINEECQCKKKRKIVFDDEGRQSSVEMDEDIHVCIMKLKDAPGGMQQSRNIAVEYSDLEIQLPDDVQQLNNMLRDPSIEKTHRNKIFEKLRLLKQEYSNEIKFNKHILIEQLKSNCDEVLAFNGTNLSTIPGYP